MHRYPFRRAPASNRLSSFGVSELRPILIGGPAVPSRKAKARQAKARQVKAAGAPRQEVGCAGFVKCRPVYARPPSWCLLAGCWLMCSNAETGPPGSASARCTVWCVLVSGTLCTGLIALALRLGPRAARAMSLNGDWYICVIGELHAGVGDILGDRPCRWPSTCIQHCT